MSDTPNPAEGISAPTQPQEEPETKAPELNNEVKMPEPDFKVYKPSNVSSPAPPPPLPDEYFSMTTADIKAAQQTLNARTQALTDAPFQPKAVREAKEQAKLGKWPNTTIRVRFPDRTQLERTFPSTDKIRSVYAFVRNSLREDVKPIKFVLYQSPPIRELKVSDLKVRDLTLAQLQLAPSSVLLLKFEDPSLNHNNVTAPLDPAILARAVDLPVPLPVDSTPALSTPQNTPQQRPSTSTSQGGEKKIPKWLKMGLKK